MQNVIMLSVVNNPILLSAVMLNIIMLSVKAPHRGHVYITILAFVLNFHKLL